MLCSIGSLQNNLIICFIFMIDADGLNGLLDQKDALKSEISLVHEIALKRNMPVNFEVRSTDHIDINQLERIKTPYT